MRRRRLCLALAVGFCGVLGTVVDAVAAGDETRPRDYEIVQYVAAGRLSPDRVVALDNNAELLLACRSGCRRAALQAAGIAVTESQLRLLEVMNLIHRDGLDWRTALPMFDAEQTAKLRSLANDLALAAVADLRPLFQALAVAVEKEGLSAHGYALFFSYVLDGMAWGFLEEYERVPVRRLSSMSPLWAGETWTLMPARDDRVTTVTFRDRGATLRVLASGALDVQLAPLLTDRRTLEVAVALGRGLDVPVGAEQIELLQSYGIAGPGGLPRLPVVREPAGEGSVFRAAETLTSAFVDWLLDHAELESVRQSYALGSEAQALVILYHEMMPSLMSALVEEGLVSRPRVLDAVSDEAADERREELGSLMFLVDRGEPAVVDDRDAPARESGTKGDRP